SRGARPADGICSTTSSESLILSRRRFYPVAYKGIVRGKIIELEEPLPYPDGQPLSVSVEPWAGQLEPGSPAAIRQVMHEPPHLRWEAVDELEQAIATGKLPVHHAGVFD